MAEPVTPRYRLLLVGRGLFLGVLGGVVCGEVTWVGLSMASALDTTPDQLGWTALFVVAAFSPLAGIVGGVAGGGIGLAAGLALALSGRPVIGQLYRARLVTGGVAAAVPLAVALQLHRPRPWWDYLPAAVIAAAAVAAAVLLTPRMLHGQPPARERRPLLSARPAPQAPASPPEQ